MNKRSHTALGAAIRAEVRRQHLIPVLLAAGSSLASAPALALELGEAQVSSTLGQPLRASIPYTLGPNEALDSSCVSVRGGGSASGLPAVSRADVSVANGLITVTGSGIAREPLMALAVNIRCPYTAQLTREYMLFIDPAVPATTATVAAAANDPVRSVPAARPPASARPDVVPATRAAATARAPAQPPIATGTRYRVQPGDSLSGIAQRIENRSVGLWDAVGLIFDANPGAFIDGDPNRLMAGTWLTIPDLVTVGGTSAVVFPPADATGTPASTAAPAPAPAAAATSATVTPVAAPEETAAPDLSVAPAPVAATSGATAAAASGLVDSAPADAAGPVPTDAAATPSENPFVTPGAATTLIPDTELDGPETRAAAPNVPAATVRTRVEEPASGGWVGWLLGGVVALVGGLLLLGRRVRDTFGSTPIAPARAPERRRAEPDTSELEALPDPRTHAVEPLADDSPTHENPALDADLVMGTGLSDNADVDVAHDFGFAATTQVDIELPEEMSSGGVSDTVETDIIPPITADLESILESEVLPEHDDEDEYDMSVIMDATKMPRPEDVTERDLAAVEIDDDADGADEYTVDQEADFEILEQDYEDEFTATQALKAEIARAAAELAESMDEDLDDPGPDDKTAEMGLASVTTIEEATARLNRDEDEALSDLDDTGVNEALTAKLEADDKTVEMPSAEGGDTDITAEMPAKRGTRSG